MERTALREELRKTLDELTGKDFKRFKHHLQEQGQIAWGKLEKADVDDTVDLIVQVYTMEAGDIMLTLLKKMNHNELAMDFKKNLEKSLAALSAETQMSQEEPPNMEDIFHSHRDKMKESVERRHETLIKKIFTDLYITEGKTEEVNQEHEILQVETAYRAPTTEEKTISYNDIFKPFPGEKDGIKTVLMMGTAGIGKTVSVWKFIHDWAEEKANEDVYLMFMLPFRELNLVKMKCSLHKLLCGFNSELKQLDNYTSVYDKYKMVIIFDGLDESRINLDFNKEIITSVTSESSMDVLITSIIRGKLLPSAHVWITSRPAAVSQIHSDCIDRFTEVRGFTDAQKEEYFRKHIDNDLHADNIISHVKASRTLHIMCHIPVFCFILASVLQKILNENDQKKEMPQTVTEMYIFFLLIQMQKKDAKYNVKDEKNKKNLLYSHKDVILKLAELAYRHLEKNSILFDAEDLDECNIDVNDASHSGMLTGIFQEDSEFFEEKIYCFVHLTIQEFFAALYVFVSFLNKDVQALKQFLRTKPRSLPDPNVPLDELLKNAVNKALDSPNGHLDLFVRFLHGISLVSNQNLLIGLFKQTYKSPESVDKTIKNLKVMQRSDISPERCINLFHCLIEMKDTSVLNEIQAFLKKERGSVKELSLVHCSALAHVLLMSKNVLDVFDLKKYPTSPKGRRRLMPAMKCCQKARLSGCQLTEKCCEIVASTLQSANNPLRELDLSRNDLQKSEEKLVFGLHSQNCKVETLRLVGCSLTEKSGDILAFALLSENSHLRELDLSNNTLGGCGRNLFSEPLNLHPKLKLEKLRLFDCGLTQRGGDILAFALQSTKSPLKELDLSKNTLDDFGEKLLSKSLNRRCKLKILRLAGCKLTEKSCENVATALQYMVSLTELDLSDNYMNITGIHLLKVALSNPRCKLQILRLADCKLAEESCEVIASSMQPWVSLKELDLSHNQIEANGIQLLHKALSDPNCKLQKLRFGIEQLRKYACELTLDPDTANTSLFLSERNRKVTYESEEQPYPDMPERFDSWPQVLCREGLSEQCYWEAEWSGNKTVIGVAYGSIERKGTSDVCGFGRNDKSWSLNCSGKSYSAWYNNIQETPANALSRRVGIYLDWPAGTLSFYNIISDNLSHLHTFLATFTEPLYPGFRLGADSSVYLSV